MKPIETDQLTIQEHLDKIQAVLLQKRITLVKSQDGKVTLERDLYGAFQVRQSGKLKHSSVQLLPAMEKFNEIVGG